MDQSTYRLGMQQTKRFGKAVTTINGKPQRTLIVDAQLLTTDGLSDDYQPTMDVS